MMLVEFADTVYECSQAVRTRDSAALYLVDGSRVEFGGVSDFSLFILTNGTWDDDCLPTPEEDTAAMLVDHEFRLTLLELGLNE